MENTERTKCEPVRDSKGRFWSSNPTHYKQKSVNGKYVQEHQLVWERANGKVPEGYLVHHINGNKRDNRLENLQLMTYREHNQYHAKGRPIWNDKTNNPDPVKLKSWHERTIISKREGQFDKCCSTFGMRWVLSNTETYLLEGISRRHLYDRVSFLGVS